MRKVVCLEDCAEYSFVAISAHEAVEKMLYALNLANEDKGATIKLQNSRTGELKHAGKTYACAM